MATAAQQLIKSAKIDPTQEYVSAGSLFGYARALSKQLDDIEREVGCDTYAKMMNDPEVSSSILMIKLAVVADGVQVKSCIADEKSEGYQRAQEIADFCNRNLTRIKKLSSKIEQMLDAMPYGNKVAELIFEYPARGEDKGKLCLQDIKIKPRESLAFVVDSFMNVVGMVYQSASGMSSGVAYNGQNILPREKFAVLTLRTKDDDPRGQSWLRAAYNAWNLKCLAWPEYLLYLLNHASEKLIGTAAENQPDEEVRDTDGAIQYDASGNPITMSAASAMANMLATSRNNTAIGIPFGAKVDAIKVQGEGRVFKLAFSEFNSEIRKAIQFNVLANAEGEHQTRAATADQSSIPEGIVWYLKGRVAEMIEDDILRNLIKWNFGEEDAEMYCPMVSLGDSSRKDWATDAEAVVRLITATTLDDDGNQINALTESQIQSLFTQVGIPAPTAEEIQAMHQRFEERRKEREAMKTQPQPDDEDDDDEERKAA